MRIYLYYAFPCSFLWTKRLTGGLRYNEKDKPSLSLCGRHKKGGGGGGGGRGRKASSLPAPFNVFYTGCPSFHLVSLCANRSRMWDKSVYCFWLLVHSIYLHPQTTWGSYHKMEISLFQLAFIVSLRMTNLLVAKEVAGILGTMSAVFAVSNNLTVIFSH